jgi:hypothetical protein
MFPLLVKAVDKRRIWMFRGNTVGAFTHEFCILKKPRVSGRGCLYNLTHLINIWVHKYLPLSLYWENSSIQFVTSQIIFRKYIFLSFSLLNLVLVCVFLSRPSNTGAGSFVFPLLRDECHDHHSKLPAQKIEAWKFHWLSVLSLRKGNCNAAPAHAMAAYKGSTGTAQLSPNLGTKWKCVANTKPRPVCPLPRTPAPIQ